VPNGGISKIFKKRPEGRNPQRDKLLDVWTRGKNNEPTQASTSQKTSPKRRFRGHKEQNTGPLLPEERTLKGGGGGPKIGRRSGPGRTPSRPIKIPSREKAGVTQKQGIELRRKKTLRSEGFHEAKISVSTRSIFCCTSGRAKSSCSVRRPGSKTSDGFAWKTNTSKVPARWPEQ